ncbi:Uncharacterised protein [Klebsiella grimontii]|uniref:Uncharacterized protein n=1 Tax=Klebsiella grimontii TaxID=2058152 RepID=A0A7H4NVI2_9ENTR|nr:Uncharacterised protein [Klebsiella grimontii]
MLRDVQPIGYLVNGILDIKDPFLIEVQDDLPIFGVVRNVTVSVHLFNCELKRLGNQIVNR